MKKLVILGVLSLAEAALMVPVRVVGETNELFKKLKGELLKPEK